MGESGSALLRKACGCGTGLDPSLQRRLDFHVLPYRRRLPADCSRPASIIQVAARWPAPSSTDVALQAAAECLKGGMAM